MEKGLWAFISKRKNPHSRSSSKERKTVGIFNAAFTGTGENFIRHPLFLRCNSRNTHPYSGKAALRAILITILIIIMIRIRMMIRITSELSKA